MLGQKVEYCAYAWSLLLSLSGFVGHHIDLTYKFLLGSQIAHVWQENEPFVSSIKGYLVSVHDDPFFATELAQQNLRQQYEDEFDIQLSLLWINDSIEYE